MVQELDELLFDMNAMRLQALLITETQLNKLLFGFITEIAKIVTIPDQLGHT